MNVLSHVLMRYALLRRTDILRNVQSSKPWMNT